MWVQFLLISNISIKGGGGKCGQMINIEYLSIFVLILCSIVLSTIISGVSYIVGVKLPDIEKVSVYECGFDPFGSSRVPFSVKFFLVGILFLIFDIEISFLFP